MTKRIMPSAQMREDMNTICRYYHESYGWPEEHTKQLRADYMEALQVENYETVAGVLAESAKLARAKK